jgi:hypothetical protein
VTPRSRDQLIVSAERRYFFQMLNLADDSGLDVYEFRLLAHYRRVCGDSGRPATETVRQTAEHCRMAPSQVLKARTSLADKGWLRVQVEGPSGRQRSEVLVLDRWLENAERYSPSVREANAEAPLSVRGANAASGEANGPVRGANAAFAGPDIYKNVPEEPEKKGKRVVDPLTMTCGHCGQALAAADYFPHRRQCTASTGAAGGARA